MGRLRTLPTHYADQLITWRSPYTMPGELIIEAGQSGVVFPESAFNFSVDKPFEIERVIIRLTALNANDEVLDVQPPTLEKRIRLSIEDVAKSQLMTKAKTLVDTLIGSTAGSSGSWEFDDVYTIERSEGFQVAVDAAALWPVGTDKVRVELTFQGSLLVVQPASETR